MPAEFSESNPVVTAKIPAVQIVLGSSSPRRKELLQLLFSGQQVRVEPPADAREDELTGLVTREQISQGMLQIAQAKARQVSQQLQQKQQPYDYLLTADTSVVVPAEGEFFRVLGKPNPARYPAEVLHWFQEYYLGKQHEVLTAICLFNAVGTGFTRVVSTQVTFLSVPLERVHWYLQTGESLGKAGGYAVQGLGSFLIQQVTGSLSNVVGLPLLETQELFEQAQAASE